MTRLQFLKLKLKIFFFAIFAIALIFRLIIAVGVAHVDLLSQAEWGDWIFKFGSIGFYNFEIWTYSWPNHPPLASLLYGFDKFIYANIFLEIFRFFNFNIIPHLAPGHMIWWFDFIKWFDTNLYDSTYIKSGYLLILKLFPILADLAIAFVIFRLASIFWSVIYLLSPFSFYLSAVWGQTDGISFLFLLLCFLCLYKKWSLGAIILFVLSVHIKPTSLIFLPLLIFMIFKFRINFKGVVLGIIISCILTYLIISVFTNENIIHFTNVYLFPKVVHRAEFRVSTNSFNFWHILIGNAPFGQDFKFIFIPAKIWGYGVFIFINLLAFRLLSKRGMENIFKGMFLVSFGGWLFLTNMLERYAFAGVVSLFFYSIYNPKILRYWIPLSLIFWINLYHGWWFPNWLNPLHDILVWQDGLVTRILSLVNVLIFIRILRITRLNLFR